MLIDTHCHIHELDYPIPITGVVSRALESGVKKMICVGTNLESSKLALKASNESESIFSILGVHPHHASDDFDDFINFFDGISKSDREKVVAIGEIGLDYYYDHSPRDKQIEIFESQIDFALKNSLPISFHVRDAFDDFWAILDNFKSEDIRGVLHCFTGDIQNVDRAINRGLYMGVTGIATFTKDESQQAMFRYLPLDFMLLETDAPYLTPDPLRGKIKINEPAFIKEIAGHISLIRDVSFEEVESITTRNAQSLFNI